MNTGSENGATACAPSGCIAPRCTAKPAEGDLPLHPCAAATRRAMRRMPRFLTYIMDEHGATSQQLICTLLEHGRLRCTPQSLLARAHLA